MNVTLWGIAWYWWVIGMFFVSAFSHKVKKAKYGLWPATALGMLAGWTIGWGAGALKYAELVNQNEAYWTEYGIAIKGVGAIVFALLIGVAILFLSAPNREGTAV